MSWFLFIDESGQDRRQSPYEVLAGIAVEDRRLWALITELNNAQRFHFDLPLFQAYGQEAKAQKLLKTKTFKHAAQMEAIPIIERRKLAREILEDGTAVTKARLTALAQAKIAYCRDALDICKNFKCVAFASIVSNNLPRQPVSYLRKDYAFLFERFYQFLNAEQGDPMGTIIFDELDKSQSHILLTQMEEYFLKTKNGRTRSRLIIPQPLFVHSDLTTMVQMADILAYVISWGVRLRFMVEPKRDELDEMARGALALRYHNQRPSGDHVWGFKVIRSLELSARLVPALPMA
ncbi:hypothetical protein N825_03625 [Skermanella stibiiresistens SB22]|uniref:DUF3800 domain-containing protein n=1 Tax=Skermanella stibiiresistens SB22 TaxID=1385369 RepID=W9H1X2_9PROT|nr:DUF3800 domain-containing protein [Skermanella stibiiresistens]EWY40074.1 hypothetical protein N825_03625 [Skermanella stibiiresistens SB22]